MQSATIVKAKHRAVPLLEVAAVVGLFFPLRSLLKDSGFSAWQEPLFGAAPLSSTLLFLCLPLVLVLAAKRGEVGFALTTSRLNYHLHVALRALMVVAPATLLFPVVMLLGSNPKQWLGGIILAIGFAAAGLVMVRFVGGMDNASESGIGFKGYLGYFGLLLVGLVLIALLNSISQLLARIILALVFAGLLEELFFRGYIQTRLNDVFGRPFRFHGVALGPALPIAAVIFGLMHPLTALGETTPWAWALWTAAMGIVLGFLREKTGSIVTPAAVHGVLLLPGVLFGSV